MTMPDDKTITATQALYWAAFRQDKSHAAIIAEANELREQHILHDRLVRHYLRHKTKKTSWPPAFYSPKEWEETKKIINVHDIPQMLATYKAKTKTTWQELFVRCLSAAACSRATNKAERELIVAARKGKITFYGVQRSRAGKILGARAEIPRAIFMADDWALKVQANELLHTPKSPRMAGASWFDLRLEQAQVKEVLQMPMKLNTNKKSPAAQADIVKFLRELAVHNGGGLPSREEYNKAATEHFTKLGKAVADRAVRIAVKTIQKNLQQYGAIVRPRGRPRRSH